MDSKPKILIIQTAYLGDVILTIPIVQNIRKFISDAEIDFMCIPKTEAVLKNNPDISRLIVYDKRTKGKISKLFRIISQVREQKYDIIICPHRSFRSALITQFSGAKIRIGFNKNSLSNLLTSRVYYNKELHEIERNLDLVRAIPQINFDENKKILQPSLFPSKEDIECVAELLNTTHSKHSMHSMHTIVSFAPCSKWFTKQLPENKSVEIIKELFKAGYRVILIGGSEDAEYCIKLEKHISDNNLLNLCGKLTPLQSKVVIENSVCLISVDSAAAHIGASTDVPLIQIYGSTVPAFGFYPLKPKSSVIENNLLTCRPCTNHGRISCPLKHFKCMEDIDVKKICDEVEKLVKK
jgi:heptosyltransferase-2